VDGVTVSAFGYGHGLTGRRAWQEDCDGYTTVTNIFLYNAPGEVTNAVLGADNHAYGYDGIGNRVFSALNAVTNTYTANSLNQYIAVTPSVAVAYDADGNMTRLGGWYHTWDAENRLRMVTPVNPTNGSERVVNGYDHRNRRVLKRVEILTGAEPVLPPSPPGNPGEWVEIRSTVFMWDNDRIAAEITSYTNGVATTNAYFWGADMSGTADGAAGVGGLVRASLNGSDVLYCYDAHGNVTELVDAHSGAVVARYRYGVFGGTVRAEGSLAAANPWRFATRYHDGETGLVMFPRRPYSPGLGRFLSRDPIGTRGGLNEYGFVNNDAVNKWDPLGLKTISVPKCHGHLIIGHTVKKDPIQWVFPDKCAYGGVVGCWPKQNNPTSPENRWPNVPMHNEQMFVGLLRRLFSGGALQNVCFSEDYIGGEEQETDFAKAVENALSSVSFRSIVDNLCRSPCCCDNVTLTIQVTKGKWEVEHGVKPHSLSPGMTITVKGKCPSVLLHDRFTLSS
jgi:RHS repeat-associated protein